MKKVLMVVVAVIIIVLATIAHNEITINMQVHNSEFFLVREIHSLIFEKQYDAALKKSNEALKKYPNSVEILSVRAKVYENLKNYSKALDDYNLLLSMKDDRHIDLSRVYLNMSYVYSDKKEYQKALNILDKAIELEPNHCTLYFRKGTIKKEMSDYQGAIKELTKAIACNPYSGIYYKQRENVYLKLNDYEHSKLDGAKADELQELSKDMHNLTMLQLNDKNDEAMAECNKLMEKYPTHPELIEIKARIYQKLKDYDTALKYYNELENNANISKSEIYKDKAFIYHMKGDNKTALNLINKAIEADKTNDDYLYGLRGSIKRSIKDYQGSIEDYTSAIKYAPYNAMHYADRATVFLELNDDKKYNADMKKYNSLK